MFVHQHTQAVGKLIYYPFIVLFLLVAARLPLFDNWGWPKGLTLLFVVNAALLIWSAFRLRRVAREVRKNALDFLAELRSKFVGKADCLVEVSGSWREAGYAHKIDALMNEIRGLHEGSYSSWFADPAFVAAFVPGGCYSILALLHELVLN
jgi:hypothetical protein